LNDDVTDVFFKNKSNDTKLQIPINIILRVKNTLEEHLLVTEKKEGKIVWSHIQFKQTAFERYSADKQEEKTFRTIMGIYFGNIVDPVVRESRCISSQPIVFGKIPVWFPGTILNRSRFAEAVYQMLQGESFLLFKAYKEICRPDVICGLIKCGEGFNLISYFLKLKQVLQTCSAKLMFKYKFMMTDSAIDYDDMLLHIDNYLAWLERDMTTMMSNPSAEIITTCTSNQPLCSKARLEVEKFIKSTRISFFEIDASSNYWIRGKSAGGKAAFDIPRLIIRSHFSGISCLACTKDGMKLASSSGLVYGSIDNSIRIFDTKSGNLLLHLQGHTDAVNSIAFHPDGTKLISASNDKTLRVFDITTGGEILMKELPAVISSVAIHPDGKHIVTACDNYLIVLSLETLFETIEIIDSEVDDNAEIEVDNLDNESIGESITTVGSSSIVESVIGHDNINDHDIETETQKQPPPVTIIEKLELTEIKRLMEHKSNISSVVYSSDGNLMISASDDNSMIMWKSSTCTILQGHTDCVNCVAFSSDDTLIVSGSKDQSVRVWNTIKGVEIIKLEGHSDSVTSVAFTHGKTFVISGSVDKTIRKWDAANGKELMKWDGHTAKVSSILVREDLGAIISGSQDCTVRLWELEGESATAKSQRHISAITSLVFSPDGHHIASGSRDATVRIWSADSGEGLKVLLGHTDDVTALAYNKTGTRLASGSGGSDNTIFIWDPVKEDWVVVLKGHTADVVSLLFSPDGNRIVSRSKDMSIRLFDTETGDGIELVGHTGWVTSTAFTPDSSRLASGSEDKSIIVWNSTSGEKVTVIEGSLSAVLCLSFNLHGSQIVSGSGGMDKSIRIWQAYTGVELKKLRGIIIYHHHYYLYIVIFIIIIIIIIKVMHMMLQMSHSLTTALE
jgi:WD40 repeat protein